MYYRQQGECFQPPPPRTPSPYTLLMQASFYNHSFVYRENFTITFNYFRTMGSNISEMNSSRGFCVEWVASVIVLVGTIAGFPLSTTHCKVDGVIGVGLVQGLVETNSPKSALKYVNFKVLIGN